MSISHPRAGHFILKDTAFMMSFLTHTYKQILTLTTYSIINLLIDNI